jgi:hypothetical protein
MLLVIVVNNKQMIIPQLNFLGGANTNISPFLQAENQPSVLNGVVPTYKLGALIKDVGYKQVGDTLEAGKDITGLFDFHQSPTVQKILATVNNSGDTALTLKYNNAGTWTDINLGIPSTWTGYEDALVEMESFIGYCFFVGYDATDNVFLPVGSLTGTTFSTSTNVTSMPQAKFIKRYRDRLYLAHCYYSGTKYEFRVYFSSVPSAGAITWTPASDFLDVDFGEQITGLGSNWDRLIVFTENSGYLYDQSIWKKAWQVGCSNHRTICNYKTYTVWSDYDGVWLSSGGQPENISGTVIDFIRNGNPRNFFACVVDEEYRLQVGSVTVNSVTYSNCELIFNFATSTWRWREYNADTPTIYAPYNDSGKIKQYIGMSDGEVMEKGKHTDSTLISSDDGNDISVNFELPPIHLGELNSFKGIKKIVAYAERAQGLVLKYRILDKNTRALTPYKKLGELTKYMNVYDVSSDTGVMLQIAGSESSQKEYFSFYGYILDIIKDSKVYASSQKHT